MHYSPRNGETLMPAQCHGFGLKLDDEASREHEKELILSIVLVPMEQAFSEHPEAHDALVDSTQGLIEPVVGDCVSKRRRVDELEWFELYIEIDGILIGTGHTGTLSRRARQKTLVLARRWPHDELRRYPWPRRRVPTDAQHDHEGVWEHVW